MESKVVDEILKAEKEADTTVKDALLKKEQDIKNAEKAALQNAQANVEKTNEENSRLFEEYEKKANEILNDGRMRAVEAAKAVKENCEINREKAIDGIVEFLKEC